jgi:hypothetical protein
VSRPPASVTVEQLAQGLGHDPVAFRRRLTELGLDRWLTVEGRVPVARVDDLVDRVKRGLPDHGASIEQLMQAQGVQTIRGEKQAPRPQRQSVSTAQQKQPQRPVDAPRPLPAAPMTIDLRADDLPPPPKPTYTRAQLLAGKAPKTTDPLPIGRGPAPSVSQQAYHITRDQLQHAQEELERRARLLTEAERAARAAQGRVEQAEARAAQSSADASARVQALEDRVAALLAEREHLLRELHAKPVPPPPVVVAPPPPVAAPMVGLTELLTDRGLRGDDEQAAAVRALADARRLSELSRHLSAADPAPVAELLSNRLVLHCGREDCPVPVGVSVVRVSLARCEVCDGSDTRRSIRRFGESLLLRGVKRLTLVGGSPPYHRILKEHLDPRVELHLIPGDARHTQAQAQSEHRWAQLILVWGGTLLDHSVSSHYTGDDPPTLRVPHRGMARMLDLAREALDGLP